jgi:hypothetical protein
MEWLKINGTDFNLKVGTYSLEEFKKEFEFGFCTERSDTEIEKVHAQLFAMANKNKLYGNVKSVQTKVIASQRKRSGNSKTKSK